MSRSKQQALERLLTEYMELANTLNEGFRQFFEDIHAIREATDAFSFTHDGKLKVDA